MWEKEFRRKCWMKQLLSSSMFLLFRLKNPFLCCDSVVSFVSAWPSLLRDFRASFHFWLLGAHASYILEWISIVISSVTFLSQFLSPHFIFLCSQPQAISSPRKVFQFSFLLLILGCHVFASEDSHSHAGDIREHMWIPTSAGLSSR